MTDFTCPHCEKRVHEGAHTCNRKKQIVETYRSSFSYPEIQNFAESQPILSGTELKKLLDALETSAHNRGFAQDAIEYDEVIDASDTHWKTERDKFAKATRAARLALEEYVELRTLTADETAVAKIAVTRFAQDVERLGHDDPDMHKALGTLQVKLSRSTYSRESVK